MAGGETVMRLAQDLGVAVALVGLMLLLMAMSV
jgi:hypothetical protein